MRIFLSFILLFFLILGVLVLWHVGGWRLGGGLCLIVAALHIEIGLRTDELEARFLRIARDLYSLIS
jgi:hypothetical protein